MMADDVLLEASNIGVKYVSRSRLIYRFEHTALKNISFKIRQGETFGVLGRNGCGKSTLLKLLAGVIKPDSGTLLFDKSKSRSLLTLGLGFDTNLSGRDNALLSLMLQGAPKSKAMSLLDEVYEFSELGRFFNQPVRTYSAGMRSRLGFSVGIKGETDLLLIDEVLSVGDQSFSAKAEAVMLERIKGRQTVVFVSHNADQVNRLCDNSIWIEKGEICAAGDTESVASKYRDFMSSL